MFKWLFRRSAEYRRSVNLTEHGMIPADDGEVGVSVPAWSSHDGNGSLSHPPGESTSKDLRQFTLDLDYSSYTVIRSGSCKFEYVERETQSRGLTFLRPTLKDVEHANEWASRNVRRYAIEVLQNKYFKTTHPKTGELLNLGATYIFDDFQTIFFFFGVDSLIGLVASDGAAGFPLSSIIIFDEKIIIHLTESFWGLGEAHFERIAADGNQTVRELPADRGVCLVAGDPNFAHHAWNELSSLQEITAAGLDEHTSLAVMHEPLGPVNVILGSRFQVISKFPRARTPEVNSLGMLTFCSMGTLLNRSLVDKILRFADDNLSPFATEVQEMVKVHGPRSLWVSVRTRNRTLGAQVETLSIIILNYLKGRPDRMVIIDGHSLPFDHERDADYVQELNDSIVEDDGAVAEQIIAAVKAALPEANIVQFVGQRIHESIAVGRYAGFYFCHHGTVQHKLGWFSSIEGLVHCNREVLELRPDEWVKRQSEVAALPVYVPAGLVNEELPDHEPGELEKHLKHSNYGISDLDRASRLVTEFAEMVEGLSRQNGALPHDRWE